MLEQRIEQDLKTALLGGDALTVSTLRVVKSAILNVKVADGSRDQPFPDDKLIQLLSKEAKKRQESADMYVQGAAQERADKELAEKVIIERYLPAQLDEAELLALIDKAIAETDATGNAALGHVIGKVKQATAGAADSAVIAKLVKERLA